MRLGGPVRQVAIAKASRDEEARIIRALGAAPSVVNVGAGTGSQPELPPPNPTLIPTVNIAPASARRRAQTAAAVRLPCCTP